MDRAIILIGVSRVSGGFQPLRGVETAVDGMQAWARSQGIPGDRIIRRTDRDGPVTARKILDDVRALPPTVDQVIIYFSGHGIVNARQEFWLLSEAPEIASEAVNLEGSITLARCGSITHVVFISDACRTAAPGLQLGRIIGSDIFPNITNADLERAVDVFFATSLGSPALEVRTDGQTGEAYNAVYSGALLRVLNGEVPSAISTDGRVRPRQLKRVLPDIVQQDLRSRGLSLLTNQMPDARITSDDDAWISKFDLPSPIPDAAPEEAPVRRGGWFDQLLIGDHEWRRGAPQPSFEASRRSLSIEQTVAAALHVLLQEKAPSGWLDQAISRANSDGRSLLEWVRQSSKMETLDRPLVPGLRVIGRDVLSLACASGRAMLGARNGEYYHVARDDPSPIDCLLEFEDGSGVLVPLIQDYLCTLEFEGAKLNDVMLEQAGHEGRPLNVNQRSLRRLVAEATRRSAFSLDRGSAQLLAMYLTSMGTRDPSLDIYATYAFHELGDTKAVKRMARNLDEDLNLNLFDVSLLSHDILRERQLKQASLRAPLLAQGWAFAEALGGLWSPMLRDLRPHLIDSTWTLYNGRGIRLLKEMILR